MKMETMNISLPPEMADFVRRDVEKYYGNVSEYFRALVREKIKMGIQSELEFLKSTEGAGPGPAEAEIERILKTQKQVRRERRARRRRV